MVVGLFLLALLLGLQSVNAGSIISNKYDAEFKDATTFLPLGTDWRLLKAQCYQESRLNPLALSPVGAMGLCQFMPNTAREMQERHRELTDFWLPDVSIRASGLYMARMIKFWSSPRGQMDRYMLALASYNAGAGNIHKAQKKCGTPIPYKYIMACLPMVTGDHSKETIDYVQKIIGKWYVILLFN